VQETWQKLLKARKKTAKLARFLSFYSEMPPFHASLSLLCTSNIHESIGRGRNSHCCYSSASAPHRKILKKYENQFFCLPLSNDRYLVQFDFRSLLQKILANEVPTSSAIAHFKALLLLKFFLHRCSKIPGFLTVAQFACSLRRMLLHTIQNLLEKSSVSSLEGEARAIIATAATAQRASAIHTMCLRDILPAAEEEID